MNKIRQTQIDSFMAQKKIAIIGFSRNPQEISRTLSKDLSVRGYELYPVNPNINEIEGKKCYSNVAAIDDEINAAIIFTKGETLSANLDEAVNKGIKHIWLNFEKELSVDLSSKVENYDKRGINIIHGYCPYMFIENPQFFHKTHRFLVKLFNSFPK